MHVIVHCYKGSTFSTEWNYRRWFVINHHVHLTNCPPSLLNVVPRNTALTDTKTLVHLQMQLSEGPKCIEKLEVFVCELLNSCTVRPLQHRYLMLMLMLGTQQWNRSALLMNDNWPWSSSLVCHGMDLVNCH